MVRIRSIRLMAKYATTEDLYDCWVCGIHCALREMWSTEERPYVKRCPNCDDNILVRVEDGTLSRAATFYNYPADQSYPPL